MAKNIKLNIKNSQIAKAINLDNVRDKLEKKKALGKEPEESVEPKSVKKPKEAEEKPKEEAPRMKARSQSAFAPKSGEEKIELSEPFIEEAPVIEEVVAEEPIVELPPIVEEIEEEVAPQKEVRIEVEKAPAAPIPAPKPQTAAPKPYERLGPTGRHVNDLLPKKKEVVKPAPTPAAKPAEQKEAPKPKEFDKKEAETDEAKNKGKPTRFKEFKDVKPAKKQEASRSFDARDRHGFRDIEEGNQWRKRRPKQKYIEEEDMTIRPKSLKVRLPITIKDLAVEMKLKASELISKLFMQGVIATLNDSLEDETVIQLLGHEFDCEIAIDTTEEKRIRITEDTIRDEIAKTDKEDLEIRPPVVAFMGHVDHGKTSLIDYIRKTNIASGEAGAITQHIGAFRCHTNVGDIAILDTPGHEAFSAMRARGADVTDIVVLVIAGDEGIRQQTKEAIEHAQTAKVTTVVAINKSDKPNFNAQEVYRQLSELELLPESWGGQTITVNCSAVTGEGISTLLEMLALQAEVLELRANPKTRARGTVLESEMHKGLGCVATVLVQNGTLKLNDALVFGEHWGKIKTMRDEAGRNIKEAPPSTPVEITGLSGLPEAGQEFIVVKSEKEAKDIAFVRMQGSKQKRMQQPKKLSMEALMEESASAKKVLNVVIRADVQGSLEALQTALEKIKSNKVELNILSAEVGDVSESDIQLAGPAGAVIIGFHTKIESHAEELLKQSGVTVRMFDIIYHAIDDIKDLMAKQLDKLEQETDKGKVEIRATFKSSQYGIIAGCFVTEGSIARNNRVRLMRNGEMIYKGSLASLKRVKEDVKEVQKGFECGIVLANFNDPQVGDIIESYEITYLTQEL